MPPRVLASGPKPCGGNNIKCGIFEESVPICADLGKTNTAFTKRRFCTSLSPTQPAPRGAQLKCSPFFVERTKFPPLVSMKHYSLHCYFLNFVGVGRKGSDAEVSRETIP